MTSANKFDSGIQNWLRDLQEPWNRLRYTIYQANLARHIPKRPLKILDAGGGDGRDAIPLASQGHHVTLVDFSQEMLGVARQRAAEAGVELQTYQAEVQRIPELFPIPEFDLVLVHNVIQYVEDVDSLLHALCQPLKEGGRLSLISINRYSETLQSALLRLDLDGAYAQIDSSQSYTHVFEATVRHFSAEEIIECLEAAGCEVIGRYGIRCVMDYIADNALKSDPAFYSKLERLELALTDKFPYYHSARFFQLVARRATAPTTRAGSSA